MDNPSLLLLLGASIAALGWLANQRDFAGALYRSDLPRVFAEAMTSFQTGLGIAAGAMLCAWGASKWISAQPFR